MKRPLSQEYVNSDSEEEARLENINSKETKSKETKGEKLEEVKPKQSSDEDGISFELSNKRRVTVRRFRQSVLVDIREFYEDKATGKELPGKKGISLTAEQFFKLKDLFPQIESAIEEL